MATIFPGKFIYYQTPRSGSNAVHFALTGEQRKGPPVSDFFRHGGHTDYSQVIVDHPEFAHLPGVSNVRNPFDIVASWFEKFPSYDTIRDMLNNQTHDSFTREGKLFYHAPYTRYFIRYSKNMLPRVNEILNHFGLKELKDIPINNAPSVPRKPYQEHYSQADIDFVWELFGSEIKEFNYTFEGQPGGIDN